MKKLSAIQEAFCHEVAKIKGTPTLTKKMAAYKIAGYRDTKKEAIKSKTKSLLDKAHILERIKELRNPTGRPSDYKPEYCQMVIDFFTQEPFTTIPVKDKGGNETVAVDKNGKPYLKPCPLPTKEGFAISINVHTDTLLNWAKKHEDFFGAIRKAENLQKNILIQNGLFGNYESKFCQFVAKNVTDMSDKQEIISRNANVEIPVDASPEDAAKAYASIMDM
jgi:hypothetical protein